MKRLILSVLMVLVFALPALGANTVTPVVTFKDGMALITVSWIDDATNGITSTAILSAGPAGWIIKALTVPGAVTAPDDNYDIDILDSRGVDLFGAALDNRSATVPQEAEPTIPYNFYDGLGMNLVIGGQTVDDATGTIYIWIKPVGKR